ncbi:MAG: WecB/TagA/CpsF family glycosyltransferase [Syntrophomonadaceae bacterium]|nr:WecB/TagA/CpsF family glycosyltransferase [Syntrophomonadaceae bacterium]MDD3023053.1 WecB/TagA/CpsF family glycosyltransferase [Syntrophomonadaceae bacterium]
MTDKRWTKANILGCMIDLVTMEEALEVIEEIINKRKPSHIITLNAEIVYSALNDQILREIINTAQLVTADGIGIVWGARRLGYKIKDRVTGIDMVHQLCRIASVKGWKIFFFGAAPGVADLAAQKLSMQYHGLKVCGCRDGYFNDQEIEKIIEDIEEQSPDILLVALGAPKQEIFINKYKNLLGVPACLGVGGSFDVLSGKKLRAPQFFIKFNLEWLYRLLSEPSRFRRQLSLPKFALKILKKKYFGR